MEMPRRITRILDHCLPYLLATAFVLGAIFAYKALDPLAGTTREDMDNIKKNIGGFEASIDALEKNASKLNSKIDEVEDQIKAAGERSRTLDKTLKTIETAEAIKIGSVVTTLSKHKDMNEVLSRLRDIDVKHGEGYVLLGPNMVLWGKTRLVAYTGHQQEFQADVGFERILSDAHVRYIAPPIIFHSIITARSPQGGTSYATHIFNVTDTGFHVTIFDTQSNDTNPQLDVAYIAIGQVSRSGTQ